MDSTLGTSGKPWFGLTLLALAMLGLTAHRHPRQSAAVPLAMETTASEVVLKPVLDASADPVPSPAQDGISHRRPTLSMPYFSFARLLRPGS